MIFLIKFYWQSFQMAPTAKIVAELFFFKQAELLLLSLTLLHLFSFSRAEHYLILRGIVVLTITLPVFVKSFLSIKFFNIFCVKICIIVFKRIEPTLATPFFSRAALCLNRYY